MLRHRLITLIGALAGLAAGLLLWGLVLGAQVRRHEPGLWSLRFQRIVECGFDYNGPPFTTGEVRLWLSCSESGGWRLWPP